VKKKIHIYDLDGTIIDSSHRYRVRIDENGEEKIDLPFWIENCTEKQIMRDKLLPLASQYQKDLKNPNVYVIVATSRQAEKNDANYRYLAEVLGWPDKFTHRKIGDETTKGHDLKVKAIRPLLNLKQFKNASVKIFEDNLLQLQKMVDKLGGTGYYIPSVQGH